MLSDLHSLMQPEVPLPEFVIEASNVGTRPAQDALVTFTAQGELQICVEAYSDTGEPGKQEVTVMSFPQPPKAPTGR